MEPSGRCGAGVCDRFRNMDAIACEHHKNTRNDSCPLPQREATGKLILGAAGNWDGESRWLPGRIRCTAPARTG